MQNEAKEIARATAQAQIAAVFLPEELDVRGMMHTQAGDKAVPFFYLNARAVMDRLDEVFGLNWGYSTMMLSATNEKVVYKATLDIADYDKGINVSRDGIGESDVIWKKNKETGIETITGDPHKSAESDALKRAAVSLGIGRYLYSVPQVWLAWTGDRQWGKFADDPREFMFNVDGSIKDTAIARDTKGKAQRAASTQTPTQAAPVEATPAPAAETSPSESKPDVAVNSASKDVDSSGTSRRTPKVTTVGGETPLSQALAARRSQALPPTPEPEVTVPEPAPEPVKERTKPSDKDAPSDYFLAALTGAGIEFDPFATKTELYDDVFNVVAPTVPNFMTAKQLGFVVSLCDELDLDYPNNMFEMNKGDSQNIIKALLQQKAKGNA